VRGALGLFPHISSNRETKLSLDRSNFASRKFKRTPFFRNRICLLGSARGDFPARQRKCGTTPEGKRAMAETKKEIVADLAPGDEPVRAEYGHDFYSWLMEQARHLREGRFDVLDRNNLAEEIESLGREQFNKLVSALRVLMAHVLKWDQQPSLRTRSWVLTIEEQRMKSPTCSPTIRGCGRGSARPLAAPTVARASRRRGKLGWMRHHSQRRAPIRSTTSSRASFRDRPVIPDCRQWVRPDAAGR
jgi:Domain of unknown function DUF29